MKDYNNINNRYYYNQKLKNKLNCPLFNLSQNTIDNSKKDRNTKNSIDYNLNNSEYYTKLNIKKIQKIQTNILNDYEYDYDSNKSLNKKNDPSKNYYHRKNYYSKDFINNNNQNNIYNLNVTNNSHSINPNYPKYNIYNKSFLKEESPDYSIKKYNQKGYNTNINNDYNKHKKSVSNTSYDFKRIKYKNNKEAKKIPVIVISQKHKYSKTSNNFFMRNRNIVKIQAAWRGYFLRKIAIGSIKKYIGFMALIKYLEKLFYNNIEYLFNEFLFMLQKYLDEKKKEYIYK